MKGLRTVSVIDALAASLRDRVLDGELVAGATLTETEVAEQYEVSRPTAKTAITMLVQAGLLRREAHKTAYVPRLSEIDINDLFLVRIPLELAVVGRIAGAGFDLSGAVQAVRDIAAVPANGPHSAFVGADLRFHQELVDLLGSRRLSSLYELLTGEIHLSMVQSQFAMGRDRIVDEHTGVLAAIEAGDVDQATTLMRQHLTGAQQALAERLLVPSS